MKLFVFLALACTCLSQVVLVESGKIINCYWGAWAYYREGVGKFGPGHIDTSLCTHISYSFFGITAAGELKSLDPTIDNEQDLVNKTIALKQWSPHLKILAVVGGWYEGSEKYSKMAANPGKRATFISSTLAFIQKHGFDGLDLDWEYPGQRGGDIVQDRINFVTLLREIKEAFAPHGLELSIAVAASGEKVKISYDIPAISALVTFINVMTYDFEIHTAGYLGFNAPLPKVEQSIDYWLAAGAPSEKLILGISFYGQSFQMADRSQNRPGARSLGPGARGLYAKFSGILAYNEICSNNWETVFDQQASAPYAFRDDQWVSYDNPASIEMKMKLVESRKLGGAMTRAIDFDDFRGLCGETYPLLKTVNRALGYNVAT